MAQTSVFEKIRDTRERFETDIARIESVTHVENDGQVAWSLPGVEVDLVGVEEQGQTYLRTQQKLPETPDVEMFKKMLHLYRNTLDLPLLQNPNVS